MEALAPSPDDGERPKRGVRARVQAWEALSKNSGACANSLEVGTPHAQRWKIPVHKATVSDSWLNASSMQGAPTATKRWNAAIGKTVSEESNGSGIGEAWRWSLGFAKSNSSNASQASAEKSQPSSRRNSGETANAPSAVQFWRAALERRKSTDEVERRPAPDHETASFGSTVPVAKRRALPPKSDEDAQCYHQGSEQKPSPFNITEQATPHQWRQSEVVIQKGRCQNGIPTHKGDDNAQVACANREELHPGEGICRRAAAQELQQNAISSTPRWCGSQPPVPHIMLMNMSEQQLLKAGLRMFASDAAAANSSELLTLPTRPNGTSLLMQASFLLRLIKGDVELKSCTNADVSAAQRDLRYLNCDQLLTIRSTTLDFSTESGSHSAHSNFLYSLDGHIFDKLAHRSLPLQWHSLLSREMCCFMSHQIILIAAAYEVAQAQERERGTNRQVPIHWAITLEPEQWQGSRVALFNPTAFQVEIVSADSSDFARVAPDGCVAVVTTRTVLLGKDKRLDWKVSLVNPLKDDVLFEMDQAANGGDNRAKLLAEELGNVLKQRVACH